MAVHLTGLHGKKEAVEISVIIPAHNAENTLRRAVESACAALDCLTAAGAAPEELLAEEGRNVDPAPEDAGAIEEAGRREAESPVGRQRGGSGEKPLPLPDYEILVIENGSEDGTEFLARTLALEHPQAVRFLRSEKGVSNARNRGLDEARGRWILFLDADDYFLPDAGRILREDLHYTGTDLIAHSYEAGNRTVHLCPSEGERFSGAALCREGGASEQAPGKKDCGKAGVREQTSGKESHRADNTKEQPSGKEGSGDDNTKEKSSGKGSCAEGLDGILVRMIENPTRYTSVWSKLLRRERIEYGKLRFDPSLRLSEDSHFLIRYLTLCRRIRLLDRPFYHYSTNGASVVRAWDGKKEEGYREALAAVQSFLKTQPQPIRDAFAGYGMMQFNLLMVREVFASGAPLAQRISEMERISAQEPFSLAIREYDPKRHRGARYLPIRFLKSGFSAGAAAVYEARVLQNAFKERK